VSRADAELGGTTSNIGAEAEVRTHALLRSAHKRGRENAFRPIKYGSSVRFKNTFFSDLKSTFRYQTEWSGL